MGFDISAQLDDEWSCFS